MYYILQICRLIRSQVFGSACNIQIRVEIIPLSFNDYMPNQNNLPFQSIFLKYDKSCVRWTQSPTSENIIQRIGQWIFSSRLTDNGKILYFPWYFSDLNHVETGVSEEGINSMKTLPKSKKSFWRVKALIISWQNSILRFLTFFLFK